MLDSKQYFKEIQLCSSICHQVRISACFVEMDEKYSRRRAKISPILHKQWYYVADIIMILLHCVWACVYRHTCSCSSFTVRQTCQEIRTTY